MASGYSCGIRSFVPLSDVSRDEVLDYLERRGESRVVMRWKYFDDAFNRGRERGYLWLKKDVVAGFIGVIPFEVGRGAVRHRAAWSCDWSVDANAPSAGMGVMLLKEAQRRERILYTFDGNDNTKQMLPRMSTRGIADAGLTWWCPLRLGPAWDKLSARLPSALKGLSISALRALPLRPPKRVHARARISAGVDSSLSALVEEGNASTWTPRYDREFLEWSLVRSPDLVSASIVLPGAGVRADAGAIVWRSRFSTEQWRLCAWAAPGKDERLAEVISSAVGEIQRRGGAMVASVVGTRDQARMGALKGAGFFAGRVVMPLWLSLAAGDGDAPQEDIADLGAIDYLCTDLAYRF